MTLDEVNLEIIRRLSKDGRMPYKNIADTLKVTENTVRSRVNRLQEEGVLEIAGLINPELLPGHQQVIIGVKLSKTDLVNKGADFSRLKGIVSVSVVTGRYDLFLTVLLREGFGLLEFYQEEVSKIDDVLSVETFVVYKNYKNRIPYVL